MEVTLLLCLLFFSFVLFVMAFFKKHVILAVLSSIGFILSGLWFWNGLHYISETTITKVSTTTTTLVDNYSLWGGTIGGISTSEVLGSFFILFGLFLLIVGASMIFSKDSRLDFEVNDEE